MHDDMNDDDVFSALRDGLSRLPVPDAPPLETIVARGRARRRRSGLAGMGLAAAGLAIALPVVVTSLNGTSRPVATPPRLGSGPVHVNLAAYSVDSNPNGTVTVALATKQNFDPARLRQALAEAGVAAVVNYGVFCQTAVHPAGFGQVVFKSEPGGTAPNSHDGSAGGQGVQTARTSMVIKPSAMPRRTELSIGYFPDHVAMTLVKVGGPLTCFSIDPPGCNVPLAEKAGVAPSVSPSATTTLPSATATTPLPPATATTFPPASTLEPATTTLEAATTTVAPATTTVTGSATSVPNSTTRALPAGAVTGLPPVLLRCQATASGAGQVTAPGTGEVTAPGTTYVTGVTGTDVTGRGTTGTGTAEVPPDASTTTVTSPAGTSR